MHVEVVYALPTKQHRVHLELQTGANVGEALNAVRRVSPFDSLPLESVSVGVFGRLASRDTVLGPGDRVEIYRPLEIDPREARRRRAEGAVWPGSDGRPPP
jgi:putative ubiquitin-RnfH superfamily antitoxin RatB of RatAB toxin-antitoxin module